MTATNGTAKFSNLAQGLAALVGASAVVAGGLYGLAVAPLQNRVTANERSIEDMAARLDRHAALEGHPGAIARLGEVRLQLEEVETQFRATDNANNLRFQDQDRFTQLLWEKVYGQAMPPNHFYPSVGKTAK